MPNQRYHPTASRVKVNLRIERQVMALSNMDTLHHSGPAEGSLPGTTPQRLELLFQPTRIGALALKNRVAMAPMTRAMSPNGVPGEDVARYYRRRAEGGVGLIVTEGTFIPHWSAGHDRNVPRLYGQDALDGWSRVVQEVHAVGGRIFSQLWHVGLIRKPQVAGADGVFEQDDASEGRIGPSGIIGGNNLPLAKGGTPPTLKEIHRGIKAYGGAAKT